MVVGRRRRTDECSAVRRRPTSDNDGAFAALDDGGGRFASERGSVEMRRTSDATAHSSRHARSRSGVAARIGQRKKAGRAKSNSGRTSPRVAALWTALSAAKRPGRVEILSEHSAGRTRSIEE